MSINSEVNHAFELLQSWGKKKVHQSYEADFIAFEHIPDEPLLFTENCCEIQVVTLFYWGEVYDSLVGKYKVIL